MYLHDPEGNGIEIYADRPRSDWPYANGRVEMANEPLDFDGLAASAGSGSWQGLPRNSTIGHVHLQVGAIAPAEAFYGPLLGFDLTCRYPGGSFFSTGGYHHHLAANVWNSLGAVERSEPTTGLAHVDIVAATPRVLEAVHERMTRVQPIGRSADGNLWLRDPWGTRLQVTLGD